MKYLQKTVIVIPCIIISMILFNCRTMHLMQTGETLKKDTAETQFLAGAGFSIERETPAPGFNLMLGVNQRFGLHDKIELQLHSEVHMINLFHYQSYVHQEPLIHFSGFFDTGTKILLYNSSFDFALLLSLGLYGGFNHLEQWDYGMLGPALSFKLIVSNELTKYKGSSFYIGISFLMKDNLLHLQRWDYYISQNPSGDFAFPFLEYNIGFHAGIEKSRKNKKNQTVNTRHEWGMTALIATDFEYDVPKNKITGVERSHLIFSWEYCFGFSTQYSLK